MFTKLSTLLAFSALVAPCLAAAHPLAKRDAFIGQTTWYGTGDSDPHVFCGQVPGFYPQLYDDPNQVIVALAYPGLLNQDTMHSLCGQTITVQWGGNTVVATVIDACASCTDNSWIDLSPGAISQLDPNYANSGVLSGITWWFNGGGGGGQATTTTDTPQWTPTSTYTPTETSTWVEPTPTSTYVYTPPAESSSTADYAETWGAQLSSSAPSSAASLTSTSDAPSSTSISRSSTSISSKASTASSTASSARASAAAAAIASTTNATTEAANGNLATVNVFVAQLGMLIAEASL